MGIWDGGPPPPPKEQFVCQMSRQVEKFLCWQSQFILEIIIITFIIIIMVELDVMTRVVVTQKWRRCSYIVENSKKDNLNGR